MSTEKNKNTKPRSDADGFPIFHNGSTGRWYATKNATCSVEMGAAGRLGQSWFVLAVVIVTTLAVGLEELWSL